MNMNFENTALVTYPSVWAVGDTYQIFVPVNTATLMWVDVAGENYYDHTITIALTLDTGEVIEYTERLSDIMLW
jgi:hypothetical protein